MLHSNLFQLVCARTYADLTSAILVSTFVYTSLYMSTAYVIERLFMYYLCINKQSADNVALWFISFANNVI